MKENELENNTFEMLYGNKLNMVKPGFSWKNIILNLSEKSLEFKLSLIGNSIYRISHKPTFIISSIAVNYHQ